MTPRFSSFAHRRLLLGTINSVTPRFRTFELQEAS